MRIRSKLVLSAVAIALAPSPGIPVEQRVFVSKQEVSGNLGGLSGADTLCRGWAHAAGLGGNWAAWLSTATVDARDRFAGDGPFLRMDGQVIANDRSDLLDNSLDIAITLDEYGATSGYNIVVTGSNATGLKHVGYTYCGDWTSSASAQTAVGGATSTSSGWSYLGVGDCSHALRVYCFESVELIFDDGFESGNMSAWDLALP